MLRARRAPYNSLCNWKPSLRTMSTSTNPTTTPTLPADIKIDSTDLQSAPGADLNDHQKFLVGSVLDLFLGRPSLKKLGLWKDDAVFEDPLTIANGRKEYSAQWYGLAAVFSRIERLSHRITSAGDPITLDLSSKYTVKGIGKEVTIDSKVSVFVDPGTGKISKVQDIWHGTLPDGPIRNAFRRLNAVSVPLVVRVPKNEEEDAKYQK